MAGSYRGLTIRIGATTEGLQRALKQTNSAATTLQGRLQRIRQGLRWDPSSAMLVTAKISTLADKAVLASSKAQVLKNHIRDIDPRAIELARAKTGELGTTAAEAASRYARVCEAIATMRRDLIGAEAYDSRLFTNEEIDQEIARMHQLGQVTDETYSHFKRLKREWASAFDDNEVAKAALKFRDLDIELGRLEAETKGAAREFVALREQMLSIGGSSVTREARQGVKMLGEQADAVKADMRELDEAISHGSFGALAANAVKAKVALDMVERQAEQLSVQYKSLEASAKRKFTPQDLAEAPARYERAKTELEEYRGKLLAAKGAVAGFEKELSDLRNAAHIDPGAIERVGVRLREARTEAATAAMQFDRAEKAFDAAHTVREAAKVDTAFKKARAEASRLQTSMNGMSAKGGYMMRSIGTTLYSTITPAAMMGLAKVVQASEEIDSAFRDMRKTVNGTEAEFDELKNAAIEFSKTHVTSADTILEIEAMGGQLGIAVDNLQAFGDVVSNLDIATNMDADTIAEQLGKLGTVLKLDESNYSNFADALVRLGNNMPALEGDIMNITTRYAGMGKIVGMSSDQVLAWATAATATGQKAEAAGSSMQRFVSNMETAVNGSKDDLEAWAKVAGMSGDEFKKSFGNDASSTMYRFIEGLAGIQKSGGSVNQTLKQLGINNVRDKQLLEGLAQQMANATDDNNVLRDSLEMSKNAWNGLSDEWGAAGDASREAEKKSEGFSGAVGKLRNNAAALAQEFGESLVPAIESMTGLLSGVEGVYKGMSDGSKGVINALAGIAMGAGPVMMGLGAMKQGIAQLKASSQDLTTANMSQARAVAVLAREDSIRELSAQKAALSEEKAAGATQARTRAIYAEQQALDKQIAKEEAAISRSKMASRVAGGLKTAGMMVGVTLAVEGLTMLADHFIKAKEREDLLNASTEKTGNLFGALGDNAENAAKGLAGASTTISEISDATEEAARGNVTMADSLSKAIMTVNDDSGKLDSYVNTIMKLGNGDLKKGSNEVNDLKKAVNEFNKTMGTSYIVDETGNILKEGKAVKDLGKAFADAAHKKKLMWQADAMDQGYKDAYNNKSAAYGTLTDAQRELDNRKKALERINKQTEGDNSNEAVQLRLGAAADVEEYENKVKELKKAYDEAAISASKAEGNVSAMNAAVANGKSVEGVVTKFEQFSKALEKNGVSGQEFADALKGLGYGYSDLKGLSSDAVKSIEEDWDGTLSGLNAALKSHGVQLKDEASSMAALGTRAGITTGQFAALYESVGGDTTKLQGKLELLAALKLDNKQFEVSDDGTIKTNEKELKDLKYIRVGDKVYEVSDDGTIKKSKKSVKDLDKEKIKSKKFNVSDGGSADKSKKDVKALKDEVAGVKGKTVTVTVKVVKKNIKKAVNDLGNKLVGNKHRKGATMRRLATGGSIVNRPTITPMGLIGEAGAEYYDGRSVIPLTNKHYMRPIAREIAANMASFQRQPVVNNYYTVGDVSYEDGTAGARAVKTFVHEVRTSARRG